ncbi:MAG: sulfotransferase, partial [Halioglobus sp.]|nr:sulfotransferase [Halioglobus sp.]
MSNLPLPVRLLNLGGGALRAVGVETVKLDLDALLQTARANTGLADYGEDDFIGPLKLLLKGLEEEAELSQLGRLIARSDIIRNLENRLGIVDLLQ